MSNITAVIGLIMLTFLSGCKDDPKQASSNVTWHKDIKPLFDSSCTGCHAEGKIAFSLETIDQVVQRKNAVLSAVTQRRMPIWLAAPGHRLYKDDPTLSDNDIAKLSEWYASGSPEGSPLPMNSDTVTTFPLKEFDPEVEVFPLPQDKVYVPATKRPDDYRCFMAEWPSEDPVRYITGFHVIPGNERIVHHLVAFKVSGDVVPMLNKLMAEETQPGYQCFGGSYPDRLADDNVRVRMEKEFPGMLAKLQTSDMWLFHWAPGMSETLLPEGIGIPVRSDDVILLQVHYYPGNGPGEGDSGTMVQFKTAGSVAKPAFVYAMSRNEWFTGRTSKSMVIPPGEQKTFNTAKTLAEIVQYGRQQLDLTKETLAVEIHSGNLHMHSYGAATTTGLTFPDGRREILLDIPVWDVHWQRDFIFNEPIRILADDMGNAVQDLSCSYVNPTQNPIYGGLGSDDEMCISMSIYALDLAEFKESF